MNQKKVPQKVQSKIKKPAVKPAAKKAILSRQQLLLLVFMLVAVFIAYLPALNKEFVNYDDDLYILNHPLIKDFSFSKIPEILSNFYYAQYSPLPAITYGIIHMIVGFKPFLYNLVALFLHLICTALVFQLIWSLARNFRVAIITAALFGLATIQVEAIAWLASAFKTAGYSVFFLASLIYYVKYTKTNSTKHIVISLLLFILSFICKEQAVALSLAVVAIDLYLGRKLLSKKVLIEKIPYFALSIACGLVAIAAARSHDVVTATSFGFTDRIVYACYALCSYLYKMIIPIGLSMFYPYPSLKNFSYIQILCPVVILVVLGLWIWAVKRKQTFVLFGGLFFLFNILFSLALQVISVREVVMADRYVYIASIGLFFIIAKGADLLLEKKIIKLPVLIAVFAAYFLFLGVMTYSRAQTWKNSVVMYTELLKYDNNLSIAYRNRGNYYRDHNMMDLAFADFSRLTEVSPENATAFVSRGRIYFDRRDLDKALADFNMAIKLDPKYAEAYSNRGAVYGFKEKTDLALEDFNMALKLNPQWKDALLNRSLILYNKMQFDKAILDLDAYLKLAPENADSYNLRGLCKVQTRDFKGAMNDYNLALQYKPDQAIYYQNRALLNQMMGNNAKALEDITKARQLGLQVPQEYLDKLK